ncbi:RHS repeat-associated core domain-containing protein [Rosenbergiella epipactidis]|nr:RHS repeat-associated core domain-containing protein [Rosenbergiella epipactidis]MCL9667290.1 RHS repeat-associated core domain-containing protein [Rosenbergiella epipactidis]
MASTNAARHGNGTSQPQSNGRGANRRYDYDAQGNRTVLSDESGAWRYNDRQQLVKRGSGPNEVTYRWGVTGELLEETRPQATTTYQYNAANQLVTVSRNNHVLAEYHYDAFGRRIGKWVDGVQQWFVYSPEGLLAQLDGYGQMQQAWGWEPGTLYGSKPLWQADLSPEATLKTAKVAWLIADNTGTPLLALNDQGNTVWKGTRDPFAAVVPHAESQITVNLRYAGQYADAETGLYYNGFRYYDPLTGRYLQPDPLGLSGGLNSYTYALNNPLSYIDPEGQFPILALAGPIARTIGSLAIGMAVDQLISYLPDNECDPWLSPRNWARGINYAISAGATAKGIWSGYKVWKGWGKGPSKYGWTKWDELPIPIPKSVGAKGRKSVVLQTGGRTIEQRTANELNKYFGRNINRREWGRALESLKRRNNLRNDDHGRILDNGDHIGIQGNIIDNIEDYLH